MRHGFRMSVCAQPGAVREVSAAFAELRGHYAFVAMQADNPELLVGARQECPLIVGVGDGESFLALPVHRSRAVR